MINNITLLSERIANSKVKEYFEEVMSSFYSKSYRSAIVMLYSITICDIIYKLTELTESYNNKASKSILDDVEKMQTNDAFSAQWEQSLIELCFQNNIIVDIVLKNEIESLRKQRNLCAHPILKEKKTLLKPNKETTLAHIVNIVDELFSKSTISYAFNDVFEKLSNDLDLKKEEMSVDSIKSYINNVYLNKINNFEVEYKFFKKFWKFSFEKNDTKCEENRMVNGIVVEILFNKYKKQIMDNMQTDEDAYYMRNTSLPSDMSIKCFIYFANRNAIFEYFTNELQDVLRNKILSSNYTHMAVFLSDNIYNHFQNTYTTIVGEINHLYEIAQLKYNQGFALDFLIQLYGNSAQFDDADLFYDQFIQPHLNDFSKDQLIQIIKCTNVNSQIYGRRKAKTANQEIAVKIKSFDNKFDFSKYPFFYINN